MKDLLIEIGAEEIPAGYIIPALEAFRANLEKALAGARLEHGGIKTLGTPRRLALILEGLAEEQRAETVTLTGPPERIGFDEDGNPTLAAEKFAQKAGVAISDITLTTKGKGRYLTAVKEETCQKAWDILEEILPGLILGIPFPKSMRWGELAISFARPIISITALLGDRPLSFKVGNIQTSNGVFGHSFMTPEPIAINSAADYEAKLRDAGVIPDFNARRRLLKQEIQKAAESCGSVIIEDEELVDIVTNLVEYPYPVVGWFDEEFLELPDEVLITAMREHQKYFALADESGRLKSCFIAVNNTRARDMELVARGHGKVIRARLADAQFFYRVDQESSLDDFAQKLKNVTFQASLGSMYEKRARLMELGGFIANLLETGEEIKSQVVRAAEICKADLVSQVVIEFTKLQGVIGRVYAEKAGETADVAQAVEHHYRPVYSGGALPESPVSKILAITDKVDSICGCFHAGLIPTGASDPYALRRQGIGIIQIILDADLALSLEAVLLKGLGAYGEDAEKQKSVADRIMGFLKNRMTNLLVDQGYSREAVLSVLKVSFDDIPDALRRVKALENLRKAPDFEPLSVAFKRVVNILKNENLDQDRPVDTSLFETEAEELLFEECRGVSSRVAAFIDKGEYDPALKEIATLRPIVDRFFDDVMVMVDDEAVKANRLALLSRVAGLFTGIADFSML